MTVTDPFRGMTVRGGTADSAFPEARLRVAGASSGDLDRLREEHENADSATRRQLAQLARQGDLHSLRGYLADARRDGYDPADRTVEQVKDDLDADPGLLDTVRQAERNGKARKGLLEHLDRLDADRTEQAGQETIDVQPDDVEAEPDSA